MKKSLLIFIALLLAAQLTACGGEENSTTEATDTTPVATEPVETEPEGPQLEVEKSDYEGHTITHLTVKDYSERFVLTEEEGSGDVLIDSSCDDFHKRKTQNTAYME